jgi:hypothetical protein
MGKAGKARKRQRLERELVVVAGTLASSPQQDAHESDLAGEEEELQHRQKGQGQSAAVSGSL